VSGHRGILIHGAQGYAHFRCCRSPEREKPLHPLKQGNEGNVAATLAMENADV
jgi:hypothetical protein